MVMVQPILYVLEYYLIVTKLLLEIQMEMAGMVMYLQSMARCFQDLLRHVHLSIIPFLTPMVTIVQPQNRLGVVQDVQIYKHVITVLMQHLVILAAVFIQLVDLIVTVIHYVMEHGLKIFHMEIVVITVLMNVLVL